VAAHKCRSRKPAWTLEADDGARTRDTWLGKPVLYRLSYVREACILAVFGDFPFGSCHSYAINCLEVAPWGQGAVRRLLQPGGQKADDAK
jgi:hypothetical protein